MATSGPRNQEDDSWWSKATATDDHDPENDLDCKFDISKGTTSGGAMCRKGRPRGPNLNGTFTVKGINGTHDKDDISGALTNVTIPLCNTDNAINISHLQAGNIAKEPSFLLDTECPSGLLQLSIDLSVPGLGSNSGIWAEVLYSNNSTSRSSLTERSDVNESPWHGAEGRLAECDADFAFPEMMLMRGNTGDSKHVSQKLEGDKSGNMDQVGKCPDSLKEFPLIDGLEIVASIAEERRGEGGINNGMCTEGRESGEVGDNGDYFIDKCASVPENRETFQPNSLSAERDDKDDDVSKSDSKGNGLMENENLLGEWSEGSKVKVIGCVNNVTSETNAHATALISDCEGHGGNESDNVNSDRLMLIDECTTTKETLKHCTDPPKMSFETDASLTQHSTHKTEDEKNENEYEELAINLNDGDRSGVNDPDSNCDSICNDIGGNDDDEQDQDPCIAAVENSICETSGVLCEKDKSCPDSIASDDGFACDQHNHNDDNSVGCPDRDDSGLLPNSGENRVLEELLCVGDTGSKVDLAPSSGQAAELNPDVTPEKSSRFFSGLELCTSTPLVCSSTPATAAACSGPRSRFGFRAPAMAAFTSPGSSVAVPAEPPINRLNYTKPVGLNVNDTRSTGTKMNSTKYTGINVNGAASIRTNLDRTRPTGINSSRPGNNLNSTKLTGNNLNSTRPNSSNLNSTRPTGTNLNSTTLTSTNLNHTRSPKGKVRHLARPPSYASKLPGPGSSSSTLTKPSSSSSRLARPPLANTKLTRPGLCKLAKSSSPWPRLQVPTSPTVPGSSVVDKAEVGRVSESSLRSSKADLTQSFVTTTSGKDSSKPGEIGSSQARPSVRLIKPVVLNIRPERTQFSQTLKPEQVQANNSARTKSNAVGPRRLPSPRATVPGHPRPKPPPLGLRTPSTRLVDAEGEGVARLGMPRVMVQRGDGGARVTPEPARSSVKASRLAKPPGTKPSKLTRPNMNVSEKTRPNYSYARLAEPQTHSVRLAEQYSDSLRLDKTNASVSKLTKPVLNVSKFSKSSSIVSKPTKPNLTRAALARPNSNTSKLERTNTNVSKPSRPDTGIAMFTRPGLNAPKVGKPSSNISKLTGTAESSVSKPLRPNSNIAKPTRFNSNITKIARTDTNSCNVSRPNSNISKHPGTDPRGSTLARPNPQVSKLTLGIDTVKEVAMLREQLSGALRACQALAIVVQYLQVCRSA